MAEILKFERRAKALGEAVPPALREFIDAVIVPALVREYISETKVLKNLAPINLGVADSTASCEVNG